MYTCYPISELEQTKQTNKTTERRGINNYFSQITHTTRIDTQGCSACLADAKSINEITLFDTETQKTKVSA